MRDRVSAGEPPDEDERTCDWIHLLPATPSDALVLGCGHGALACALARRGARVTAVDGRPDRLAFLGVRAAQEGLVIRTVSALSGEPPGTVGSFDLIVAVDPTWPDAGHGEAIALDAGRLLRPGGCVAWRSATAMGRALARLVERLGTGDASVYATLPDRGIPFFLVPLGHGPGMRYFLERIVPLVATASPETLRRYGVPRTFVRLAARAASIPGLARLAEAATPGRLVIARSGGRP